MAEALKTFREGEDILASETNENNQYLLSKLSDNAAQVHSYVEGEVATIKSNVASVQATLQNNIDELQEKVETKIVIIETIKEGNKWCRVWSDGWKEQGGVITSTPNTATFLKAFSNTNYTVQATYVDAGSGSSYENLGCFNRTTRSMLINRGESVYPLQSYVKVSWYVCGY